MYWSRLNAFFRVRRHFQFEPHQIGFRDGRRQGRDTSALAAAAMETRAATRNEAPGNEASEVSNQPLSIRESASHPTSFADVEYPTIVRHPAITLIDSVSILAHTSKPRRGENYSALKEAFETSPSVSGTAKFVVSNVAIPSRWVKEYRMGARGERLSSHHFDAIVHFGLWSRDRLPTLKSVLQPRMGALSKGISCGRFRCKRGEIFRCVQHAGDTVYIPPGWVHRVTTQSNGSVLIGETKITRASIAGFVGNASKMVTNGVSREYPEPEAAKLCEQFKIQVGSSRRTSWYGGPAMSALRAVVAQESGGSVWRDAGGKRRRKRFFSSRHQEYCRRKARQEKQDKK